MRWARHVARIGEMHTKCWSENRKGRNHVKNVGVDVRLVLLKRPVAGSSEHGNVPSGSRKGGEFLDWLSDY